MPVRSERGSSHNDAPDAAPDNADTLADSATARPAVAPPPAAATDEFIPIEGDPPEDAWADDPLSPDEGYDDAWDPEGVERRA